MASSIFSDKADSKEEGEFNAFHASPSDRGIRLQLDKVSQTNKQTNPPTPNSFIHSFIHSFICSFSQFVVCFDEGRAAERPYLVFCKVDHAKCPNYFNE